MHLYLVNQVKHKAKDEPLIVFILQASTILYFCITCLSTGFREQGTTNVPCIEVFRVEN